MPGRVWSELLGVPVALGGDPAALSPVIDELHRAAENSGPERPLLTQSLLLRLLAGLLVRLREAPAAASGTPLAPPAPSSARFAADPRIRLALDYLRRHPERFPATEELCRLTEMSASHLRKLFVRYTGMPPLAYMHHWKAAEARRLLETTHERVNDIARRLGYGEAGYFARIFRERAGMSPSEYRRRHRAFPEER